MAARPLQVLQFLPGKRWLLAYILITSSIWIIVLRIVWQSLRMLTNTYLLWYVIASKAWEKHVLAWCAMCLLALTFRSNPGWNSSKSPAPLLVWSGPFLQFVEWRANRSMENLVGPLYDFSADHHPESGFCSSNVAPIHRTTLTLAQGCEVCQFAAIIICPYYFILGSYYPVRSAQPTVFRLWIPLSDILQQDGPSSKPGIIISLS